MQGGARRSALLASFFVNGAPEAALPSRLFAVWRETFRRRYILSRVFLALKKKGTVRDFRSVHHLGHTLEDREDFSLLPGRYFCQLMAATISQERWRVRRQLPPLVRDDCKVASTIRR